MGTTSAIGVKSKEGSIEAITCHFDGYPSHVGRLLLECYGDEKIAKELLALGSLSSLEEKISPPAGVHHSFERPAWNVTIAYHRDRSEDYKPPFKFTDVDDYRKIAKSKLYAEYVYLLDAGVWNVLKEQKWVPVASVLENEGIQIKSDSTQIAERPGRLFAPPIFKDVPLENMENLKARNTRVDDVCSVKILAVYRNSIEAALLAEELKSLAMEAYKKQEGIDAGENLFLFDGKIRQFTRGVEVECWVKRGISDKQAPALIRLINGNDRLQLAIIEWCTPTLQAYGEITWDNGQLTTLELPQLIWNNKEDFGRDKSMLSFALAAHGQEREIATKPDE